MIIKIKFSTLKTTSQTCKQTFGIRTFKLKCYCYHQLRSMFNFLRVQLFTFSKKWSTHMLKKKELNRRISTWQSVTKCLIHFFCLGASDKYDQNTNIQTFQCLIKIRSLQSYYHNLLNMKPQSVMCNCPLGMTKFIF